MHGTSDQLTRYKVAGSANGIQPVRLVVCVWAALSRCGGGRVARSTRRGVEVVVHLMVALDSGNTGQTRQVDEIGRVEYISSETVWRTLVWCSVVQCSVV